MAYRPNPYMYGYQQPYGGQGLIKVTGLEGARAYPMAPNSSVVLFDEGEDVFYFKTTDGAGYASIRVFEFTERIEQSPTAQFVTKDELKSLLEEIKNELKGAENGKQPVQPESKK